MLEKSGSGRIVNVSSIAHRRPISKLDLDNLNSQNHFDKRMTYGNSKLCNLIHARELARRGKETGNLTPQVVEHFLRQLFVQQFIEGENIEVQGNIEAPHYRPEGGAVDYPHIEPVTRRAFPCHDVIMFAWYLTISRCNVIPWRQGGGHYGVRVIRLICCFRNWMSADELFQHISGHYRAYISINDMQHYRQHFIFIFDQVFTYQVALF